MSESIFLIAEQNNSGGYFIINEDVDEYVVVEGNTINDVRWKYLDVIEDNSSYCECCGPRWYEEELMYKDDIDKLLRLEETSRWNCVIHLKDGSRKKVYIEYDFFY